jgi:hypothetical protein
LHCQTWPCWQQTTARVYFKGDKSWQKYIKITRENLCHRYSVSGKSFETGIVPRCQVYCSRIVHIDYPIKIQNFHMLGTKLHHNIAEIWLNNIIWRNVTECVGLVHTDRIIISSKGSTFSPWYTSIKCSVNSKQQSLTHRYRHIKHLV